jgi:hypothetical protein
MFFASTIACNLFTARLSRLSSPNMRSSCFGRDFLLKGQSLVPDPPAIIIAYRMAVTSALDTEYQKYRQNDDKKNNRIHHENC